MILDSYLILQKNKLGIRPAQEHTLHQFFQSQYSYLIFTLWLVCFKVQYMVVTTEVVFSSQVIRLAIRVLYFTSIGQTALILLIVLSKSSTCVLEDLISSNRHSPETMKHLNISSSLRPSHVQSHLKVLEEKDFYYATLF